MLVELTVLLRLVATLLGPVLKKMKILNDSKMIVRLKRSQVCGCGRHVKSANYYCIKVTYYDNSDLEEDSFSSPLSYHSYTSSSKAKSNSGKKVHSCFEKGGFSTY